MKFRDISQLQNVKLNRSFYKISINLNLQALAVVSYKLKYGCKFLDNSEKSPQISV